MDEILLMFDIAMGITVVQKGEKLVLLQRTGHKKSHFMVILVAVRTG